MMEEGIHQCAGPMARRRMHHQSRRLVDHDEILVLIDHLQRNILALWRGRRGGRNDEGVRIPWFDPVIGVFYCSRAQRNGLRIRQLLEPRAGEIGQGSGKKSVQPPAGVSVIGKCRAAIS